MGLEIEAFGYIKSMRMSQSILNEAKQNVLYAKLDNGERVYNNFSLYVRSAIIKLNKEWQDKNIKRKGRPKLNK